MRKTLHIIGSFSCKRSHGFTVGKDRQGDYSLRFYAVILTHLNVSKIRYYWSATNTINWE